MWYCRNMSLFGFNLDFPPDNICLVNKCCLSYNVKTLDFPFQNFKAGYKFQIHRFIIDVCSQLLV